MYMYNWVSFLYTWNSIINQLYTNRNFFLSISLNANTNCRITTAVIFCKKRRKIKIFNLLSLHKQWKDSQDTNGNRRVGWWMGTGLRVRFSDTPHKSSSIIVIAIKVCCAKLSQSCLTLCDPMDCSPPGSTVRGILKTRILEWVAMPSFRGSSQPRDQTCIAQVSCIAGSFFTIWVITWEAPVKV